ncbi:MAG: UDP-N-acetylglucosamine--N-acetylmuramyl-(pentapeptide) pyrophosphoryl-undecaprenol N-acetylglucosamine transferase [Lentisphaerae bacterium]|nr:UDP-N-acetylglucosamine--N-acetylmuramyl-(pentapeptide) pyrophosphoryl-undecaprenol N-acetylglucosamine transferase [Lentisphaerota bacterium]
MTARIAIASGGTGGHFYPTLAIARELQRRDAEVTLLVAGRHAAAQRALASAEGLAAIEVPSFRMPDGVLSALAFPWRAAAAVRAARREVRSLKPEVLLGMGSFAAVPACLAARREGVPLVLHEGNAWMGRANRAASRWARCAGLSLPLVEGCPVHCPTVTTGMPLRAALVEAARVGAWPEAFAAAAGLSRSRRTLLVFGGSQGARFINDLLRQTAPLLAALAERVQVLHLTGTDDNAALLEAYRAAGLTAWVRRSEADIQHAYLAADLVLCRGGASSLCELALFGKAAIVVPLPTAAEDHQTANARVLAARQAIRHWPQREASPAGLAEILHGWLADPGPYEAQARAIRALAMPDAATRMAALCLEHVPAARPGA